MKKIFTAVIIATAMAAIFSMAVSAKTIERTIELRKRSALVIDQSASMQQAEDAVVAYGYDAIFYLSDDLSQESQKEAKGNSRICEAIDHLAKSGFSKIVVVTDGEQHPREYSALGGYTDLDLCIVLTQQSERSDELIEKLKERMVNSSLTVVKPDGAIEKILEGYNPETYVVSFELTEYPQKTQVDTENVSKPAATDQENHCYWWLAIIAAASFDLIHELITQITRRKKSTLEKDIKRGIPVLADMSGSLRNSSMIILEFVRKNSPLGVAYVFSNNFRKVNINKISTLEAGGETNGWNALKEMSQITKKVILVTDCQFTDDENISSVHFDYIRIVLTGNVNENILEKIKGFSEKFEIEYLNK